MVPEMEGGKIDIRRLISEEEGLERYVHTYVCTYQGGAMIQGSSLS